MLTIAICGIMFISHSSVIYRLDSITNKRIPMHDGVYKNENPFCLYKIEKGKVQEIEMEDP